MEKLKKVAMIVFFPITLLIIGFKIYMSMNKNKADESLKKTDQADRKLELQEERLKQAADVHEAKADKIQADIDKGRKEPNNDLDWHKKV